MVAQEVIDYITKREALRKRWIETGDVEALEAFLNMNRRKVEAPIDTERRTDK